jgi:hypothetical protein
MLDITLGAHWLPVKYRIDFKVLVLAYKCRHGTAPRYLVDLLPAYVPGRSPKSGCLGLLQTPRFRLGTYGGRTFTAGASRLWNAMPFEVREAESLATFRRQLKTVLFTRAYGQWCKAHVSRSLRPGTCAI